MINNISNNKNSSETKRILLFTNLLHVSGGAERLMLEGAKYFKGKGIETFVAVSSLKKEGLFDGRYANVRVEQITPEPQNTARHSLLSRIFYFFLRTLHLRRTIQRINPEIIIGQNTHDAESLFFSTLFTRFSYSIFIHGTIFWFPWDTLKYAGHFRKVFNEIRESVAGHKEFVPVNPPELSFAQKLMNEIRVQRMVVSVRKAAKIFVLSKQMGWEVHKLFGKEAVMLKGAIDKEIFRYKPKRDIKKILGLEDKMMILNVNRLDPRKRVDLLVKAFSRISSKNPDAVLIIGGTGEEEEKIKHLITGLHLEGRARLIGHIPEPDLFDYYAACDVFAHPNWADYAIAPLEALALGKKVVWSTEMEMEPPLLQLKGNYIFPSNPAEADLAKAMEEALYRKPDKKPEFAELLSGYTWDRYFEGILKTYE